MTRPSIERFIGLSLVLMAMACPAKAQSTVYRCGPDGREYSATPCASGKPVSVDDARSLEQQRQGQETAARDSALADRLAAQRRQREAATPRAGAIRIGPAAAASAPSKKASQAGAHKARKKHRKNTDPTLSDPVHVPKPKR